MYLPNAIIIGVQKSGTTSLFYSMVKHPEISGPTNKKKELHFFSRYSRWKRGVHFYKNHFLNNNKIILEGTPVYILKEEFIRRMHSVVPNAKIIITLRDPVDRVYSQYQMMCDENKERKKTLMAALKADELRSDNSDINNWSKVLFSYLERGLYKNQIENVFKYYPENRVFIDEITNINKSLSPLFKFLEVEDQGIKMERKRNRLYPSMNKKTRKYLEEYYRGPNRQLEEFLGRKFSFVK